MESEKAGYRNIIKSTTLFGGVKIFQVLLNLIRGKIIAVLLGPSGVGLNGLYTSTIAMINSFSGLGLSFSAVRDISKAKESGDIVKLSRSVTIFKKWLIFTSMLGFSFVILFSPVLSRSTFGSSDYTLMFIVLALMIAFNTLSDGNASLLQGTRNLSGYAKYSITGTIIALAVSVPLYYFFGLKAVVPALILSSFLNYMFSIYYVSKVQLVKVTVSFRDTVKEGSGMIKLGIAMMVATSIGSLVNYLINIFIQSKGSIADFGLYQAGMSITSQAIGLVFASMAIDYYPKLVAVCEDGVKVRNMVNRQAEVMLLVATPILILLMIVAPIAIRILLSREFSPIAGFIRIISVGMVIKSASYSIGAISFAKGDKKTFFILEGIYTNSSILIFSIVGYYLGGLNGLGYGFALMHAIYFVVINIVTRRLYSYSPSKEFVKILATMLLSVFLTFLLLAFDSSIITYTAASVIFIFVILFSLRYLKKVSGFKFQFSKNSPDQIN